MALKVLDHTKILKAAISLIDAEEALTFSRLATVLGTRSQALYNYYPNVSAIRVAMVDYFYSGLFETLQKRLGELGDKADIIEYGLICRKYSLEHYSLMQLALATPGKKIRKTKQQQELRKKYLALFNSLLEPLNLEYGDYLIISRALRNLVVGEVSNVGSGWFSNTKMSSEETFKKTIELLIRNCKKRTK
ncbi:TetR/AcrR family transcriptional regulator [Ligilactobacillus sp. WILCCON 0076]|uniref:TetR/AcrR family transcriptional regulator n=1 Tax=Ligilactobacillus ubinensis TaxID=2876789 RepID=A0A9X2FJM8_9LACO|nr:TetR/AcrR family transcriptional regulator [Ligilactobacillus ubinensis]MCP0885803.1 TetR/AcrR family transcriptional regulator [Ligilactobacillus ubinensis]